MMIDYEFINKQIQSFNPLKQNPRDRLIQEQINAFMKEMNAYLAKAFQEQYNKPISNYPTDEMVKFTTENQLATLCMSNALCLLYDEDSNCIVFNGCVYDEHQRGIGNDEFNALLLWTRIFAKIGSIELVKHDKEAKLIEFKVLDKRLVNNLIEYVETDIKEVRERLKSFKMEKYAKYLDKYENEKDLKKLNDEQLNEKFGKDMNNLMVEMMNDISRIMRNGK
jgi:hypothetical protein